MLTSAYVCWAVFDDNFIGQLELLKQIKKFKKNKSPISSFATWLLSSWFGNDVGKFIFFNISFNLLCIIYKFCFYFWSFKFSFVCIKYSGCIFFWLWVWAFLLVF